MEREREREREREKGFEGLVSSLLLAVQKDKTRVLRKTLDVK